MRPEQETYRMRKRSRISSEEEAGAEDEEDGMSVSDLSDNESRISISSAGKHDYIQYSAKSKQKELITTDHLECWGCKFKFAKPTIAGKDKGMDAMWKCYSDNKDLPVKTLSQMIQQIFDTEIYEPLLEKGDKNIIPWVASAIETHIMDHMVDVEMIINRDIRELSSVNNMLTTKYSTKAGEPDYQAIMASLKIRQQRIALVNNKLKLSMF